MPKKRRKTEKEWCTHCGDLVTKTYPCPWGKNCDRCREALAGARPNKKERRVCLTERRRWKKEVSNEGTRSETTGKTNEPLVQEHDPQIRECANPAPSQDASHKSLPVEKACSPSLGTLPLTSTDSFDPKLKDHYIGKCAACGVSRLRGIGRTIKDIKIFVPWEGLSGPPCHPTCCLISLPPMTSFVTLAIIVSSTCIRNHHCEDKNSKLNSVITVWHFHTKEIVPYRVRESA
jgi:hypothetical protein